MTTTESACGCGGGECRQCWADMIASDYRKTGKQTYCECNHEACGTCDIYRKLREKAEDAALANPLACETADELRRQRAKIDAELERRSKEETRTVYTVTSLYGRETHKHFEGVRKLLLEEIKELSVHDLSPSQRSVSITIKAIEWPLSEYNARPDIVYG